MFSAKETAAQLNTDAKTLRRFLRQDELYANAGSGGRYTFTDDDMTTLTERFTAWRDRPKTTAPGKSLIPDADGLPASIARSRAPRDVAAVKALSDARVDRIEAALLTKGLHISQMREGRTERAARLSEELTSA